MNIIDELSWRGAVNQMKKDYGSLRKKKAFPCIAASTPLGTACILAI